MLDNILVTLILGGVLIGLAAGLLTLFTGRVMSASGMIGSLLGGAEGLAATSIAFIGGILVATLIMTSLGISPILVEEASWPILVAGGLLVGFAARFGSVGLVGSFMGMARRTKNAASIFLMILVGAAIAVYLKQFIVTGGAA